MTYIQGYLNDHWHSYKFNLYFIFSAIRKRFSIESYKGVYYKYSGGGYVSDYDIGYLIDDLLYFLKAYPSNPYIFMNRYFSYVFFDRENYNN